MVSLNPKLEKMIQDRMKRWGYSSANDLLAAAIASFDQVHSNVPPTDAEMDAMYPGWREKIEEGLREADAGNVCDGPAFFRQLRRELASKRNKP